MRRGWGYHDPASRAKVKAWHRDFGLSNGLLSKLLFHARYVRANDYAMRCAARRRPLRAIDL